MMITCSKIYVYLETTEVQEHMPVGDPFIILSKAIGNSKN